MYQAPTLENIKNIIKMNHFQIVIHGLVFIRHEMVLKLLHFLNVNLIEQLWVKKKLKSISCFLTTSMVFQRFNEQKYLIFRLHTLTYIVLLV